MLKADGLGEERRVSMRALPCLPVAPVIKRVLESAIAIYASKELNLWLLNPKVNWDILSKTAMWVAFWMSMSLKKIPIATYNTAHINTYEVEHYFGLVL